MLVTGSSNLAPAIYEPHPERSPTGVSDTAIQLGVQICQGGAVVSCPEAWSNGNHLLPGHLSATNSSRWLAPNPLWSSGRNDGTTRVKALWRLLDNEPAHHSGLYVPSMRSKEANAVRTQTREPLPGLFPCQILITTFRIPFDETGSPLHC